MTSSKRGLRLLTGALSASLIAFSLTLFVAGELLTWPINRDVGQPPSDLAANTVSFSDVYGRTVSGWSISGDAKHGTALLLHGIRADRRSMLERARFLSRSGYSVLMIDLSAHGKSYGKRITFGYQEANSVVAALAFARSKWPGKKIAIIGSSLGGAAAIFSAPQSRADAYILEAVYSNIRNATQNRLELRFGAAGRFLTPLLLWQLPLRLGISVDDLSPADQIDKLARPTLIIAGENDRRTSVLNTQDLFARAKHPKTLWLVPGARHQDFHAFTRREYEQRVLEFLENNLQ